MSSDEGLVVLDLAALPAEVPQLDHSFARVRTLAASVVLDRIRKAQERDAATIEGAGKQRAAEIVRVPVDDRARASYADFPRRAA